jgi:hypothetical protein
VFRGKAVKKIAIKKVVVASDTVNVALVTLVPCKDPLQTILVVGGEKGCNFLEA